MSVRKEQQAASLTNLRQANQSPINSPARAKLNGSELRVLATSPGKSPERSPKAL